LRAALDIEFWSVGFNLLFCEFTLRECSSHKFTVLSEGLIVVVSQKQTIVVKLPSVTLAGFEAV
jgi:hypothetical protein